MWSKRKKPMDPETANRYRYLKTKQEATDDEMVCGYYVEGVPQYFVMPKTATDEEIRARTFELMNGRPMSEIESLLTRVYDRNKDFAWDEVTDLAPEERRG